MVPLYSGGEDAIAKAPPLKERIGKLEAVVGEMEEKLRQLSDDMNKVYLEIGLPIPENRTQEVRLGG